MKNHTGLFRNVGHTLRKMDPFPQGARMHKPRRFRLGLPMAGLLLLAGSAYVAAQPPMGSAPAATGGAAGPASTAPQRTPQGDLVVHITKPTTELEIIERFSRVVEVPQRIKRVDGFDPQIVDVTALTPNQVRVQAIAPGVTTMILTVEDESSYTVNITVTGDVRHLQAALTKMFPKDAVQAFKVRDAVVLRGWVTQPDHITQIVEIAREFFPRVLNQMRVGGVQQVQLKVKVMEVQRSKIRQLGFNFADVDEHGLFTSTPGALVPVDEFALPFGGPGSVEVVTSSLGDLTSTFGIATPDNVFLGFLEALKEENLLKVLAEPTLTALNGHPARFRAGGRFFIPVAQQLGQIGVEDRPFGVELEFVPIVLDAGRVRMEVRPSVSERDFANATQFNGTTIPAIIDRVVNTQVEMRFGETLMIAGLISTRGTANTSKVPIFGELPWVGSLFRRVRYEESETEVVIMVTPELVAPLDPSQVLPGGPGEHTDTPTDRELFLDGMVEVPRIGPRCVGCPPPSIAVEGLPEVVPAAASSVSSPETSAPLGDPVPSAELPPQPPAAPGGPVKTAPGVAPGPTTSPNGPSRPMTSREPRKDGFRRAIADAPSASRPLRKTVPGKATVRVIGRTGSPSRKPNTAGLLGPEPGLIKPRTPTPGLIAPPPR